MARPEKWKPEYTRIAEHACKLGATDHDVADMLGVSVRTLYNWRLTKPELAKAMVSGKQPADDRVERSLYQRAIGYEQEEVKIFMPANATAPVYAKFTAKYAPDTTACIFWLKNRRPEQWRDKPEGDSKDDLMALLGQLIESNPS